MDLPGAASIGYIQGHSALIEAQRASLYEAVLSILGTTGTIFPIGDPKHGLMSATTFKTVGAEQVVVTPSEPLADWATKPGIKGIIPVITFDGTANEMDTPDIAYLTRALAAATFGAWVNMKDATSSMILSKRDNVADTREYQFGFGSTDKLNLVFEDENAASNQAIQTTADSAVAQDAWVFALGTYDGSADATGIDLFQDGLIVASTDVDNASFVSMRDTASKFKLGFVNDTPASLFDGKMAGGPLGPFYTQTALSADQVLRLYELGRRALNL